MTFKCFGSSVYTALSCVDTSGHFKQSKYRSCSENQIKFVITALKIQTLQIRVEAQCEWFGRPDNADYVRFIKYTLLLVILSRTLLCPRNPEAFSSRSRKLPSVDVKGENEDAGLQRSQFELGLS